MIERDPKCVERWPECESGAYDPRCCRFPKSCSCERERRRDDEHSMRVDVLAARRQERADALEGSTPPVWDEAGAVDVRLLCGVAALTALALIVWLAWPYIVCAVVMVAGWRIATAHTRRRRPRSSWSSLGRTAALMYAAWNSRWLKGATVPVRVSVPAAAGREHVCGDCGRDDTVPF